jgi:hypothetical protein
MAYHKWSNLKLTLNDYKAILSCHMAQSSCFNWMVEGGKKYIFYKMFQKSKWCYESHSLVEISQNVTRFGNIVTTRSNFNYFGHSHNYDATIRNFILLVGLIHPQLSHNGFSMDGALVGAWSHSEKEIQLQPYCKR